MPNATVWPHAPGHLAGIVIVPLLLWPIAALLMWVTRLVHRQPASQGVA